MISCGNKKPNTDQIRADLIGKRIGSGFSGWIFASMDEFEHFEITDQQQKGDLLEYKCKMRLRDTTFGGRYKAEVSITYIKKGSTWDFVSVSKRMYEKL